MNQSDKMADAIRALVYRILNKKDAPVAKCYMAVFTSVNAVDVNLSKVTMLNGDVVDYVPKSNAVTGLTAGDPVLLIKGPAVPLTIIAKVHGDISVATL